jgi:hypothetical protein
LAIPNEAQTVVRGFQRENPPLKLSNFEFLIEAQTRRRRNQPHRRRTAKAFIF